MTDLLALADRVEAGDASYEGASLANDFVAREDLLLVFEGKATSYALSAVDGSLDAALTLKDAILPGWKAIIDTRGHVEVSIDCTGGYVQFAVGQADKPSRAMLAAILRAKHAEESK